MRRLFPALGPALATLAVALAPAVAAGQAAVAPKPLVLILLDTSGSMEYVAGSVSGENGDVNIGALPSCLGPTFGTTRFITAQQVLTGTYQDYSCVHEDRSDIAVAPCPREDCPYPVPHVRPQYSGQLTDGLLDRSGSDFKFGITTFDTKENPSPVEVGAYSYGPETNINLGARNFDAPTGAFIKPTVSDNDADVQARNNVVQDSILTAVPYGGTPLAPQLYDARYYFETDPDHALDPYFYCRSKNVILITDGVANLGEGEAPYATAAEEVRMLRALGVHVYVIGFQLAAGVDTKLEELVGDPGPSASLAERTLHLANSTEDLANAFRLILGAVPIPVQSRTRPLVTEETGNSADAQYQINAAYANVYDAYGLRPGVRQGILERSVYRCGADPDHPDQAGLWEVQRLSDKLNAKPDAQRRIYTMAPGLSEPSEFRYDNLMIRNQDLALSPSDAPFPDFSRDGTTGHCKTGFLTGTPEAQVAEYRRNLFDWIRATDDSCRRGFKTGSIIHSTPELQGHLAETDVQVPSFLAYKDRIQDRPSMMYVGTADGLLHAFQLDRSDGGSEPDSWGDERWAYVPRILLKRLKEAPNTNRVLFDGTPVVKDVLPLRRLGEVEDAFSWKSILIAGLGQGGRGYVALDVTDPSNAGDQSVVPGPVPHWRPLWEISATEGRCLPGEMPCRAPTGQYADDFRRLGWAVSRPEIGNVAICPGRAASCDNSQVRETAVAVFGGGGATTDGGGYTVFVVDAHTGEKLAEFNDLSAGVDSSCNATLRRVGSPMVGDVACYSTFPGTFISRCYLGDAAGRLWRLDLGSPGIPNWQLQLFYDPYKSALLPIPLDSSLRAPAYEAPALAFQREGNRLVVVYGGGDPDNLDERTSKNFVVSLTEYVEPLSALVDPARSCSPWSDVTCRIPYSLRRMQVGPNVNWKRFLGYDAVLNLLTGEVAGERMMGSPVIFSSLALWVTWKPDLTRACSPGQGTLFGVHFTRHDGADCSDMAGRILEGLSTDFVESVPLGDVDRGAIPYGLTIAPRPACYAGSSLDDVLPPGSLPNSQPLSALEAPAPQVIVQTGVQTTVNPSETPSSGTTQRSIHQAVKQVVRTMESLFVSSWGSVFD